MKKSRKKVVLKFYITRINIIIIICFNVDIFEDFPAAPCDKYIALDPWNIFDLKMFAWIN